MILIHKTYKYALLSVSSIIRIMKTKYQDPTLITNKVLQYQSGKKIFLFRPAQIKNFTFVTSKKLIIYEYSEINMELFFENILHKIPTLSIF